MQHIEKFNSFTAWLLSLFILAGLLVLPGNHVGLWVLVPIVLCGMFRKYRLEIVFLSTLIASVFFSKHFFSIHLFSFSIEKSLFLFSEKNFLSINSSLAYALAMVVYVLFFFLLFKIHKRFVKQLTFFSTIALSFAILAFVWLSQFFFNQQSSWTVVFALSALVLSKCAFYIFNYILFFDKLPTDKTSAAAVFQPFWFITFEVPENPSYAIEVGEKERELNLETLKILLTCVFYKTILILFFTAWNTFVTGKFSLVIDDMALVNSLGISILRDWKTTNAFFLLLCLFSYSFSFLGSSFFVQGRIVVAIGRLCGFNLPDYINSPWRSHSFADFFSRMMYYYNIIIVNLFFYPALEFFRKFKLSSKARVFVSLNWALIFGGFLTRFLKDVYRVYKFGFFESLIMNLSQPFTYTVVLALAVSTSLYFEKKKKERSTNIPRMFFYFFLFSLIMPLNFWRVFGDGFDVVKFYLKIFSLGIF